MQAWDAKRASKEAALDELATVCVVDANVERRWFKIKSRRWRR